MRGQRQYSGWFVTSLFNLNRREGKTSICINSTPRNIQTICYSSQICKVTLSVSEHWVAYFFDSVCTRYLTQSRAPTGGSARVQRGSVIGYGITPFWKQLFKDVIPCFVFKGLSMKQYACEHNFSSPSPKTLNINLPNPVDMNLNRTLNFTGGHP